MSNRLSEIQLRLTTQRYGRTDRLDLEFLLARLAAAEALLRRVASGEETAIIFTPLLEEIEQFLGKESR